MRRGARAASFSRLESGARGIWELHFATRPIGDGMGLLTVRVVHMAPVPRTARLVELVEAANALVRPYAAPVGEGALLDDTAPLDAGAPTAIPDE